MYSYVLIFILELENKIDETCLHKKRLELFLLFKPYFDLEFILLDKVKTVYSAQWSSGREQRCTTSSQSVYSQMRSNSRL